jgi:hypothetical protein
MRTTTALRRDARLLIALATFATISALCVALRPAGAQVIPATNPVPARANLSGPRFGLTMVSGQLVDSLRRRADVGRVFTQFGWQFERQFFTSDNGPRAVSEVVVLVGALDQGSVIPSASWMVGMRMPGGAEFGVGPNVSPAGTALALAFGATLRYGYLNVPVNVAVVPGKLGLRTSILTGFNSRR